MHQTFYIDVDEEVNSVISRIRKSNEKYNILVIAHGALLMQSAVSLKLIKREADALEKKVMIITKDELAAAIAKKIGFPVRKSLEEVNDNKNVSAPRREIAPINREVERSNIKEKEPVESMEIIDKKNRLVNLGSDSFMSTGGMIKKPEVEENLKNSSLKKESSNDVLSRNNFSNRASLGAVSSDSFENLFLEPTEPATIKNKENLSAGNALKFLWIFIIFIGILLLAMGAYFYLPSAQVTVFPLKKTENISLKLDVSENPSSGSSANTIGLKTQVIEDEAVLSNTFDATGQKGDSNQKAKGVITIYNEFSETSQVLVATTRFLSNDNKLFRLLETVTVPGMTIKDGKTEAGKIEADIVADEAGSDFNIKEATFTIPGLVGSAKHDKFYAKLTQETKGGGNSGSDLKAVSKSDIENAKFKTENQLKSQLKESVKNKLGLENQLLDNAISYEVLDFSVFPEEGAVTENFEYQVRIKVKTLAFSSKEMDEKIVNFINSSVSQKNVPMELSSFEKNYGNADIDFAKKTIKMDVSVNGKLVSKIDKDKISSGLAGKKKEDMSEIIGTYPEVSKAEAIVSPNFISNSFPKYPSKINIEIGQD